MGLFVVNKHGIIADKRISEYLGTTIGYQTISSYNAYSYVFHFNYKNKVNIKVSPYFKFIGYSEIIHVPVDHPLMFPSDTYRILIYKKNFSIPGNLSRTSINTFVHEEYKYLNLCDKILKNSVERIDRTNVGTFSLFGESISFDLSNDTIPILTTKNMAIKSIIEELLWFIRGHTDSKLLEEKGINIWTKNSNRSFLDKKGLVNLKEGDIGSGYGFQWRHSGATYIDCDSDYKGQGFDQLDYVFDLLKNDRFSRKILMCAWNPSQLTGMALEPCHVLVQFYVREENGVLFLSSHLYQRSADVFLGLPFNITSYSVLTHLLAKKTGMIAEKLTISLGDSHIYKNHVEQVRKQLCNVPRPFPKLKISDNVEKLDWSELDRKHFEVIGYYNNESIKAEMAA